MASRAAPESDHVLRKFVPGPAATADDVGASGAEHGRGPAVAGHERVGRPLAADAVDGSALLVLGDFGPFAPEGRIISATLQAVEEALVVDGGVHRYLEDEYYGGGVWVVLAGALAIVVAARDEDRARAILEWIEAQADEVGLLPEQVPTRLRTPASETAWIERWGPPARPLLWSHAMYLLGVAALEPSAAASG